MTDSSPTGKTGTTARCKLSPNGHILVPAAIREELGIEPGETLLMEVTDGVLRIESYRNRIRRIQAEFANLRKPEMLASEELIAERRVEARLAMEDFEDARAMRRIMWMGDKAPPADSI